MGEDERQEPRAGGGGPRYRVSLRGHRQSAHTGAWSFMRAMEGSGIGAIESLWFVVWRMALWGLGLGLGLGAAYGTLVGIPFVPFGLVFGPVLGAMYGTMAGLALGLLEGLVLGVLTVLQHRRAVPGDFMWYRRAAQLACVVACMLAVVSFWGIAFWRERDSASVRVAFTGDLLEAFFLVVGPLLVATGATWFAARRVAGTYSRETVARSPRQERKDEGT